MPPSLCHRWKKIRSDESSLPVPRPKLGPCLGRGTDRLLRGSVDMNMLAAAPAWLTNVYNYQLLDDLRQ